MLFFIYFLLFWWSETATEIICIRSPTPADKILKTLEKNLKSKVKASKEVTSFKNNDPGLTNKHKAEVVQFAKKNTKLQNANVKPGKLKIKSTAIVFW